jgi:hypothetical protein
MSRSFNPGDRLVDAHKEQLTGRIPEPLHERLDQLCDLAYEAGEPRRPGKAEMLAAVILASPTTPQEVRDMFRDYGNAKVVDAFLPSKQPTGSVVTLPERTSGPRSISRRRASLPDAT